MNFTDKFLESCQQARAENITAISCIHSLAIVGASDDGIKMATLAAKVGVSPATETSIISQLENMKLVVRDRTEKDRRAVIVRITDEGLACLARIFPTKQ